MSISVALRASSMRFTSEGFICGREAPYSTLYMNRVYLLYSLVFHKDAYKPINL